MQLSQGQILPPPIPADARPSEHPPTSSSAAQAAARWAARALDPRGSLTLLGRGGAALAALALQAPRMAAAEGGEGGGGGGAHGGEEEGGRGGRYVPSGSSCYATRDFTSPSSGALYALETTCDDVQDYVNRFIKACGAVAANTTDSSAWTRVRDWGGITLSRQNNTVGTADDGFIACLTRQTTAEETHDYVIGGIVIGSVVGGGLVICAVIAGVRWYRDVKRQQREGAAAQRAYDAAYPKAAHVAVEMQPQP